MITYLNKEKTVPYSDSFLQQLQDDVRELALDRRASGGTKKEEMQLLKAAMLIGFIRMENDITL